MPYGLATNLNAAATRGNRISTPSSIILDTNIRLSLGTAENSRLYFDGSNFICDPNAIGSGSFRNLGTFFSETWKFGGPGVRKKDRTAVSFEASADTNLARGNALISAISSLSIYDSLEIGSGIYDVETNVLTIPDDVSVFGRGMRDTLIYTQVSLNASGAAVKPGNRNHISRLGIIGNAASGIAQAPFGTRQQTVGQSAFIDVVLSEVYLSADADGLFFQNNSSPVTMRGYNLEIETKFDAVRLQSTSASNLVIELYNCKISVVGPSSVGGTINRGIAVNGGICRVFSSSISVINGGTGWSSALETDGTIGRLEVYGSSYLLTSNGANPTYDLNGGAPLADNGIFVSSSVVFDPSKVSGEIKYFRSWGTISRIGNQVSQGNLLLIQGAPSGFGFGSSVFSLNPASAPSGSGLIWAGVNGSRIFGLEKDGTIYIDKVTDPISTTRFIKFTADGGEFYDYNKAWFSMSGSGSLDDGTNFYIPYNPVNGWYLGFGMGANDFLDLGTGGAFIISGNGNFSSNGNFTFLSSTSKIQFRNGTTHFIDSPATNQIRFKVPSTGSFLLAIGGPTPTNILTLSSTALTFVDSLNAVFGISSGTKLGTATNQLLSFWNATPISQPANTLQIDTLLVNTGLRASGGVANFSTTLTPRAGTASAGTAPLKFGGGTNMTTAEAGAAEYNGTNLFFTRAGTTRENVWCGNNGAGAPGTNTIGVILDYYGTSATRVLTTPNSWGSVNLNGVDYVVPLYVQA